MCRILLLLFAFVPAITFAGLPFEVSLEEMAKQADHILVGRVVGVDMVNGQGRLITDPEARTGPGLDNTIRLRIQVDQVLVSSALKVPDLIPVSLSPHLHYTLGQIKEAHDGDTEARLVLLKGPEFVGIKPGVFFRPLTDKDLVLRLHAASH
ncbi:MAG: hypothetical protein PHE38_15920 [Alishewanella agri]|uniref:Uncharacterized protein n=1 Tax=Alishewanella jeotgali KCTC 22429 TaxID=1129374 RepID=H3ZJ72_9ALTE|nr:hypothetical protein [Alishewanella jeotgali]EHR39360.1 hypothetical protein AJE_17190 [Alishewanella jeotgali KCTC 22429]MDD4865465.1 hypothetical protein [Alishewanella agri]